MIVAIMPAAPAAALEARCAALPIKDPIVEVRFDLDPSVDPSSLRGFQRTWIGTCRRLADGGAWTGTDAARVAILRAALDAGARWVDVEHEVALEAEWLAPSRTIASFHDLHGTPSGLEEIVSRCAMKGFDRIKIATRVDDLSDVLRLRRLSRVAEGRVMAFGLGPGSTVSRVLHGAMGNPWIYLWAGDPDGLPKGLGLLEVNDAHALYGPVLSRGEVPIAFGVVGAHAESSIGPWVFNRIFRKHEIPPVYLPVSTQSLVGLREMMRAFGFRGLSVTNPFKEAVLPIADRLHPLVERIGAANTLVFEESGLVAYNTDYRGVLEPVREALGSTARGGLALVLGAGGAARAAALALAHLGFEVRIHARRPEVAERVAGDLDVTAGALPTERPRVIVNATPLGGRDAQATPLPEALIGGAEQIVLDAVYAPEMTPLIRLAKERGASVIRGGEMYAVQARHQLHLFWSGLGRIDSDVEEAVLWALAQRGYR